MIQNRSQLYQQQKTFWPREVTKLYTCNAKNKKKGGFISFRRERKKEGIQTQIVKHLTFFHLNLRRKKRKNTPGCQYPFGYTQNGRQTTESLISKQTGKNIINKLKMTVFKHSTDPTVFTFYHPHYQCTKIYLESQNHRHTLAHTQNKDSNSTKCIQFKHQQNVGHNKKRQTKMCKRNTTVSAIQTVILDWVSCNTSYCFHWPYSPPPPITISHGSHHVSRTSFLHVSFH